jgi:hypothetical protein
MTHAIIANSWDLISSADADRWLREQGVNPKESTNIAYKVAGKMSRASLQGLYENHKSAGSPSLIDTALNWLKLYNLKQFGTPKATCITDVTCELPCAGLVANGVDMPKLVPELIKSAVGINTVREFAADYINTTSGLKPILGNGLLSLSDRPTSVVTHASLISLGFITAPFQEYPVIETLAHRCMHRSVEVWACRLKDAAASPSIGHRITKSDITLLEARWPQLAKALVSKLAFSTVVK